MNAINYFIRFLGTNMCILFSFYKLVNTPMLTISKKVLLVFTAILLAILQVVLLDVTSFTFRIGLIYFIYLLIIGKIFNTTIRSSIVAFVISLAITYIATAISTMITILSLKKFISIDNYSNHIVFFVISFLSFCLIYLLFKLKRLERGLPFIKQRNRDDYFDIFILLLSVIIIFIYSIIRTYLSAQNVYLIIDLMLFSIIMLIIIFKSFILYHKQKLQTQALKDYEKEIADTKAKLETALEEKQTLVKSNHEFYHRQEALNKKLNDLIEQQKIASNTEFANELTNISDRLNTLSSEYSAKTANKPKLVKCNIEEIDDMLSYMQLECIKNKIQFTANIDYNVNDLIGKFISKSQLETLLGDLIRNSIIAINHTNKEPREIMVVFGSRDKTYELAIFDTGIPFEISTLINLGLKPASTHLDEGGSGIGFITTFETLKDCKASFIINELSTGNYTKSLIVRFDGNCEYIITSARADEIAKANTIQRNIKIEPKDE